MGCINLPCNMEKSEAEAYFKEFDEWMSNEEESAVSETFTQYLFYDTWGRKNFREFTCTHTDCGSFELYKDEDPEIFEYSHGESVCCPHCGNEVILVSLGRMRSFRTLKQERRIVFFRTGSNGALLLTAGWATKEYSYNDLRPTVWFKEKKRICLLPGKRMQWGRLAEWNGWRYVDVGWQENDRVKEPFNPYMYTSDGSYYPIGIDKIQDSQLKYCQLSDWYYYENKSHLDVIPQPCRQVVKYLSCYTEYPTLEMAVKLGIHTGATELVMEGKKNYQDLNWKAKTAQDFLRLSKPDARLFVRRGYNLKLLQQYHRGKKLGQMKKLEELDVIVQAAGGIENVQLLQGCAAQAGCSMTQAINYLCQISEGKTQRRILTMWKDYMDMAQKLQYDTSRRDVIMPKELVQRHDNAAQLIAFQKREDERAGYKKRLQNLKNLYAFELDGMIIRVPESAEEIVAEGKALEHCVGGYAARHMKGVLDILFLRKAEEPDTPYITIEMPARKYTTDKVNMIQIHGYQNDMGGKQVNPRLRHKYFLDTWENWLIKGSPRDGKNRPIIRIIEEKSA